MRLFRSLAYRLTLQYAAIFLLSMLLIGGLHYWSTLVRPLRVVEGRVTHEAQELAAAYQQGGPDALASRLEERLRAGGARLPFHAFIGVDGQSVSANLSTWPRVHAGEWLRIDADSHFDGEDQDHEALVHDQVLPDGARLLVGRDIEDIDELEEKLLSVLIGIVGSTIALGAIGGMLMSHVIGRRISTVTHAARAVMAGDLSGRIPTRGTTDDFDQLTATLNAMLARTEQLVESVRRVSDSVAHELRTPLARLRADLEPLKSGRGAPAPEQMDRIFTEVETLEKTFDAVLRISRLESRRRTTLLQPVDLAMLLADAAELYAPAAEEKEQSLTVSAEVGVIVEGDRDLLFQSVCNLLDNAIKYSAKGGAVVAAARRLAAGVELTIADNGPGIPVDSIPHVTERFYRVPSTAAAPGAGLGLSLVAAVAERHESSLRFGDAKPGLLVRWIFAAK